MSTFTAVRHVGGEGSELVLTLKGSSKRIKRVLQAIESAVPYELKRIKAECPPVARTKKLCGGMDISSIVKGVDGS